MLLDVQSILKVSQAPLLLPTAQQELDTLEHQALMLLNVQSIWKVPPIPTLSPNVQPNLDTMA